ncbi:MAG: hypothetical protein Q8L27_03400 [archaeon]|nr:hypothetical protein [archaeon]
MTKPYAPLEFKALCENCVKEDSCSYLKKSLDSFNAIENRRIRLIKLFGSCDLYESVYQMRQKETGMLDRGVA